MPEQREHVQASACPDAESLAAYIDGRLSGAARERIETHMASCPNCYETFVQTVRLQGASGARVLTHRRFANRPLLGVAGLGIGLAASILIVAITQPRWFREWRRGTQTPSEILTLVDAVGDERTVEGRLTGGFKYGPLRGTARGRASENNWKLLAAAGEIRDSARRNASRRNLHALGIAHLLLGELDQGVETLEEAVDQLGDPTVKADLAAAYLARGTSLAKADDLPRALEMAERALASEPTLVEAAFTRAIALERVGLKERAIGAWEMYLELDSDSGWANEARQRLDRLRQPTPQSRWPHLRRGLESGDRHMLEEACGEFPDEIAELVIGRFLPAWMDAHRAGKTNEATGWLELSVQAADLMRARANDGMLVDAVGVVNGSARKNGPPAAFAQAVNALGLGTIAVASDAYLDAEPQLRRARDFFGRHTGALFDWASYELARVLYFKGDPVGSQELLSNVIERAQAAGYKSLAGRALWVRGIVQFSNGRWPEARNDYERALAMFESAAEPQNVATVHVSLSMLFRFLGEREELWRHRVAAMSRMPTHKPALYHGYLITTAVTASLEGLDRTALVFADEGVRNAEQLSRALQAEVLLQRAKLRFRLGEQDQALSDLRDATSRWQGIIDGAVKTRVGLSLSTAIAQVNQRTSPNLTIAAAREAIASAATTNDHLRSAELHLYLTRALRHEQRYEQARDAVQSGIREFERARRQFDPHDPVRLSVFEPVWDLFDESVRVELEQPAANVVNAFATIERGRARTLFEATSARELGLPEVQAALKPHTALLLFHQQDDGLLVWLVRHDLEKLIRLPFRREDTRRLVAAHRRAVIVNAPSRDADKDLAQGMLTPVVQYIPEGSTVVIVPDDALWAVAWSSLRIGNSAEPVLRRWSIVIAPSVAVALRPGRTGVQRPEAALVVAAPLSALPLPPLSGAREEGIAIAKLYRDSVLIQGVDATSAAVLRLAPRFQIVHIGAHALNNPAYPMLSRLLLAPDAISPEGLFVRQLVGTTLQPGAVVILAACASAGQASRRGEGSIGLAWGFLVAGAQAVVATLWEVDDRLSVELFLELHRHLHAGVSPAVALREAQMAAVDRGIPESVWAAMQVIGHP